MEEIKEMSLKFSESPLCPIAADVISDGESIYFYMYDLDFENERLIARSACWVKNLVAAPKSFQKEKIEQDHQPVLPSMFVDEAMSTDPWNEEALEIVWSKEGHIAGLLYNGEVVCVIPSWADEHNFPGYALYAKENNMVSWRLQDASPMVERILEGKDFWKQEFNEVWKNYNTPYFSSLSDIFGAATNCYDLNKDRFPSRLLLTFEKDGETYVFTIGTGMFSMPNADRYYAEYEEYARCEFAMKYPSDSLRKEEELELFTSIAGLCSLPWHAIDCVGHGHTLDIRVKENSGCVLIDDDKSVNPLPLHLKQDGVRLYWIRSVEDDIFTQLRDEEKKTQLLEQLSLHTELL